MKKLLFLVVFLIFNFSCFDEKNYIPIVSVNIDLDLNLPEYEQLNTIGSSLFITGGVKGIIVYHFAINEYRAYDRNCSYEPSLQCARIDSIYSSIAFCGCCSSAFLLDQNGMAANSPAINPLREYSCVLNENKNTLHIFNKYY
ncbi:MAG: hypothetical protein VX370_02295 [Bacteroidota bacterium]|nr:hypothetical protein [Bacteroidota bacterium]